jgi:hypothetical protein
MKAFSITTIIRSTSETVWKILADAAGWTEWNPTIVKVEGKIAPGEKITAYSRVSPGRAFPLKVTEFIPSQRMVWSGGRPPGLFRGERTYKLTRQMEDSVKFSLREEFSGLRAALIPRSIPGLQPSFEEFAAALRTHAEKGN